MVVVGGLVSGEWCLVVVRSGQDCATSQGLDGQVVGGGCDDRSRLFFNNQFAGCHCDGEKAGLGMGLSKNPIASLRS